MVFQDAEATLSHSEVSVQGHGRAHHGRESLAGR